MSLEMNNEALQAILSTLGTIPGKRKYGKAVVFGDSLSYGIANTSDSSADNENGANYSFVDILQESGVFESITNRSYGGACVGPYSVYEDANEYCLTKQIERYSTEVQSADIIFLEYGGNDQHAFMQGKMLLGFATDDSTQTTMCGYIRKSIARIRELNPAVHICWLAHSRWTGNVPPAYLDSAMKEGQEALLLFEATVYRTIRSCLCTIINLSEGLDHTPFKGSDGFHPDTTAHRHLAELVLHNMYANNEIPYLYRTYAVSGSESAGYTIDGSWIQAYFLVLAEGVTLRAKVNDPSTNVNMLLDLTYCSTEFICFSGQMRIDNVLITVTLAWSTDGSVNIQYG